MKPVAVRVVTGHFAESPIAQVFQLIQEDRETATLVCRNGDKKRALFFTRGTAVDAESNVPGETFVDLLKSMEKVTPQQYATITDHEGGKKSHAQLAVEQGILPVRDIVGFLRIHVMEVAMALFQESAGQFKLILGEIPERGFSARIPIPELIFAGAKKLPLEMLASYLGTVDRKVTVTPGKNIEAAWQLSDFELKLAQSFKAQKPTYKSVIEQGDRAAIGALLYALEIVGYLAPQEGRKKADSISELRKARIEEVKKEEKQAAKVEAAALPKPTAQNPELPKPAQPAAGMLPSSETSDLARYEKLEEMTYYEILQIKEAANDSEMKASYFRLAKLYHPDRFFNSGAETIERARRIFETMSRAYNTLKDPLQRKEYEQTLEDKRTGKSKPQNVKEPEEMIRARVSFQQAISALEIKDYNSAVESLRRTVDNNPTDARAWGMLADLQARFPRWRAEAMDSVERALSLKPDNPDFLYLKAALLTKHSDFNAALPFAQRAAQADKDNPKFKELLSEIESRIKDPKGKGSGFLSKLFG